VEKKVNPNHFFNAVMAALIAVMFSVLAGCAGTNAVTADGKPDPAAVGGGGDEPALTWTLVTQSEIPDYMESVAYGNGKFVVVGRTGDKARPSKIAYSTDGITWTAGSDSAFSDLNIGKITFCGGKFFAVSYSGTVSSTDGVTWTRVESSVFNRQDVRGPVYGDGKFVVTTYSGRIAYSADGIAWTDVANRPSGFKYRSIAYGGGKFVAAAEEGKMAYSTDSVTWMTSEDSTWGTRSFSIAYGNGRFVASGWEAIAYSTDGVTWTRVGINEFSG
jgi:hypothetical protein